MDFLYDYSRLILPVLDEFEIPYDDIENNSYEIIHRFVHTMVKFFPLKKYSVEISKELQQYLQVHKDYKPFVNGFKHLLESGNPDVYRHLSKSTANINASDYLLGDWGFYHFHTSFDPDKNNPKWSKRTGNLLIVKFDINSSKAYFIAIKPHGNKTWGDKTLLEILDNNWPDYVSNYKIKELIVDPFDLSPEEYHQFRQHVVMPQTINGQSLYPLGGGIASDGSLAIVTTETDCFAKTLKHYENFCIQNEDKFIRIIQKKIPEIKYIDIHLEGLNILKKLMLLKDSITDTVFYVIQESYNEGNRTICNTLICTIEEEL